MQVFQSSKDVKDSTGSANDAPVVNTGSYFSGLSAFVKYTGSQWSFAQLRILLEQP